MKTEIQFKKLHPAAVMPSQGSLEAAGFDLVSTGAILSSNNTVIVSTSLAVAFPQGHVLLIYGRSGLAFKSNIRLVNGVGVIDADYRGEIKLAFASDTLDLLEMQDLLGAGSRVAQAILMPIPAIEWREVDELPDSIRGESGLGSTGLR